MLIRALDFRGAINCVWDVGRKYINHMAATEIMMAMAAVLREWINSHACCSVRKVNRGGRYGEDMTFLISIYLCLVTSSVCCETASGFSRWLSSPLTLCMLVEYR